MSAVEVMDTKQNFNTFIHQIQCDINFLESRLKAVRTQHQPNQHVIQTYEEMLGNRVQVLNKLKDELQKTLDDQ